MVFGVLFYSVSVGATLRGRPCSTLVKIIVCYNTISRLFLQATT